MENILEIDLRMIEKEKEEVIEEIEEVDLVEEVILKEGVEIDYLMMIDNLHHFLLHNYFIIWEVHNVVKKMFRTRIYRKWLSLKIRINSLQNYKSIKILLISL